MFRWESLVMWRRLAALEARERMLMAWKSSARYVHLHHYAHVHANMVIMEYMCIYVLCYTCTCTCMRFCLLSNYEPLTLRDS